MIPNGPWYYGPHPAGPHRGYPGSAGPPSGSRGGLTARAGRYPRQNVRVNEVSEVTAALTADLIVAGNRAADPVISPDGRWVAWVTSPVAKPERRVSDLWLAPVGGSAAPVRLTDGSVCARLPRWSPDSASLFYVTDGEVRR